MRPEDTIVKSFILPARQERYLSLLLSAKGRRKFIERLAHQMTGDLDPRFAYFANGSAKEIELFLKKKAAPDLCYVISENSNLDEKELPLGVALAEVVGYFYGTIIACIPGSLAYFEGEGPKERYILERKDAV